MQRVCTVLYSALYAMYLLAWADPRAGYPRPGHGVYGGAPGPGRAPERARRERRGHGACRAPHRVAPLVQQVSSLNLHPTPRQITSAWLFSPARRRATSWIDAFVPFLWHLNGDEGIRPVLIAIAWGFTGIASCRSFSNEKKASTQM